MKNAKHLLGYIVVALLSYFLTKKYFCEVTPIDPPVVHEDCVVPVCKENCDTAKAIIPLDEVAELYRGFDRTVTPFDTPREMTEQQQAELQKLLVTRGVWFDYDHFKEYLSVIDKNAKEAGIKISGLRFYPSRSIKDDNQFGQLTLFYNPTYRTTNSAGVTADFAYALERNGNELKPILLEDIIQPLRKGGQKQAQQVNEAAFFSLTSSQEQFSQAGDRGQISPPPTM